MGERWTLLAEGHRRGTYPVYRLVPEEKSWLPQDCPRPRDVGRLCASGASLFPSMPPRPVILLEGFEPGSPQLRGAIDMLPVVDPAKLFLQAHCIAPSDRICLDRCGSRAVYRTLAAIDAAVLSVQRPPERSLGTDTIILDMGTTAVLDLVMAGVALPAVPMSDVVAGYTYDLLADGRWVNRSDQCVIRVDVSPHAVCS